MYIERNDYEHVVTPGVGRTFLLTKPSVRYIGYVIDVLLTYYGYEVCYASTAKLNNNYVDCICRNIKLDFVKKEFLNVLIDNILYLIYTTKYEHSEKFFHIPETHMLAMVRDERYFFSDELVNYCVYQYMQRMENQIQSQVNITLSPTAQLIGSLANCRIPAMYQGERYNHTPLINCIIQALPPGRERMRFMKLCLRFVKIAIETRLFGTQTGIYERDAQTCENPSDLILSTPWLHLDESVDNPKCYVITNDFFLVAFAWIRQMKQRRVKWQT
jgi:hypothetical protein